MNPSMQHSGAWVSFTYANLAIALVLVLGGLFYAPLDFWTKGYFLMSVAMLVSSTVSVTKTVRDVQESGKLVNRIEDAKAEQLLTRIHAGN